jgi:hypothetical protein
LRQFLVDAGHRYRCFLDYPSMSTEEKVPEPEKAEPQPFVDRDWFLQRLVGVVNNIKDGVKLTMSMTVVAGGVTISGQLTSYRDYFKRFSEGVADGFARAGIPAEAAKDMAKNFDMGESLDRTLEAAEKVGNAMPAAFLHLIDARIVSPAGIIPTSGGSLWRCRISEVAAFTLGNFSTD